MLFIFCDYDPPVSNPCLGKKVASGYQFPQVEIMFLLAVSMGVLQSSMLVLASPPVEWHFRLIACASMAIIVGGVCLLSYLIVYKFKTYRSQAMANDLLAREEVRFQSPKTHTPCFFSFC